jgi:chemotaxis protein histidine kinase CheA
MNSVTFKITYNNDTRKITSSLQDLHQAVSDRFGLSSPSDVQLWFEDREVDLDEIQKLAARKPGKAVKLLMRLNATDTTTTTDDSSTESDDEVDSKVLKREAKLAKKAAAKAAKQTAKAIRKAVKAAKHSEADIEADEQDVLDTSGLTASCIADIEAAFQPGAPPAYPNLEQLSQDEKLLAEAEAARLIAIAQDPKALKRQAKEAKKAARQAEKATKQMRLNATETTTTDDSSTESDEVEPKVLQQEAKLAKQAAAKAARQAEKAARQAGKAAQKALRQEAKRAAMESRQAMKAAKHAAQDTGSLDQTIYGKLLNVGNNDAVKGEVTILACGRICFHVDTHPGNLRVCKNQLQTKGGRGPWAQFSPVPVEKVTGVFRLMSQAQPECFLGATTPPADAKNATMTLMGGLEFSVVEENSPDGLWSFYAEGCFEPMEFDAPASIPSARQVYSNLQEMIALVATNTSMPIQLGDAPEDENALIEMLNQLHEFLPHGIKRIAMKKVGLRQFQPPQPDFNEEWDMLLDDLKDMGFSSEEENKKAVEAANGDLKKAIKVLVQAARQ